VAAVALITGATGLIGSQVLATWAVDDLEPVPVLSATTDLLAPGAAAALVADHRPAVVVHLAWSASGNLGYRNDPANAAWVRSSLELAKACKRQDAWLLATGTPLDDAREPSDEYSRSKASLRKHLQPAIDAGACTWLRPFYVVDPDRGRPELVQQAFDARESGTSLVLRTPESQHDFIHASDVGRAVVAAVQHRLRGEVSIGSGELRRVRDLVTALGVSWSPDPNRVASSRLQRHEAADVGRLLEVGWSPICTTELFTKAEANPDATVTLTDDRD
jgi:nucleoside-diphosphate-sugar epimerase